MVVHHDRKSAGFTAELAAEERKNPSRAVAIAAGGMSDPAYCQTMPFGLF